MIDADGAAVRPFAALIADRHGLFGNAYVHSDELGADGRVDGLPLGELTVRLAASLDERPEMYDTEACPPRTVVLERGRTTPLTVRVDLLSRLRLSARARDGESERLLLLFRDESDPEATWRSCSDFRHYFEGGSYRSGRFRTGQEWFSDVLPPGTHELEVRRDDMSDTVWHGRATLGAGEIGELEIEL